MDIPSLSVALSQSKSLTNVGTAVLGKAIDTAQEEGAAMVNMIDSAAMERSVTPHIGGNFDMSV